MLDELRIKLKKKNFSIFSKDRQNTEHNPMHSLTNLKPADLRRVLTIERMQYNCLCYLQDFATFFFPIKLLTTKQIYVVSLILPSIHNI